MISEKIGGKEMLILERIIFRGRGQEERDVWTVAVIPHQHWALKIQEIQPIYTKFN